MLFVFGIFTDFCFFNGNVDGGIYDILYDSKINYHINIYILL